MNYHKVLGIDQNANKEEIRGAYLKLALKHHPDRNLNNKEEAEKKFKEINKAFEMLYNGEVKEYGYDYGEEIEDGELAVSKYTDANSIDAMNEAWGKLFDFYIASSKEREENPVSDYHLIRAKNMLKVLNSYYKSKYLAAKNEIDRAEVVKSFRFWDHGSGLSNQKNWQNNFDRCLRMLNYAQGYLGLPKTTNQDLLQIKVPKNKKPVEDGVVNIEEYNNLWIKQNHVDIDKYWKIRGEIYNTKENLDKYIQVNPNLYKEMNAKAIEAEKGAFRSIWETNKAEKISEVKKFNENKLEKMKEAMKLMEKLIEEGKNYKPKPVDEKGENKENQDNSTPQSHVHEVKSKEEETEIYQEIAKEEKKISDKLEHLINEAQTLNDYEALKAKINEISKYWGEREYESQQTVINQLKSKLVNLNKDKFVQESQQRVENLIESNEVKKDNLSEKSQQALAELKNEKDVDKINRLESIVNEEVGEEKAKSKLAQLLEEVEKVIREGAKFTIEQVKKVKKDLHVFCHSNNKFNSLLAESKQKEIREAMLKLDNYSTNNTQPPKPSFFRPAVIIPSALVVTAGLGIIVVLVRNRNRRVNKRKV